MEKTELDHAREIENDCGGSCTMLYAKLDTFKGAKILNPRRTLYKANSHEKAKGAKAEPLTRIPRFLKRLVKRLKRRKFVLSLPECGPGCFCDEMEKVKTVNEERTLPVGFLVEREEFSGYIMPDPSNPNQEDEVLSGQLSLVDGAGSIIQINPEIDIVRYKGMACCASYKGWMDFSFSRRFWYEAEVEANWKVETWIGECAKNPELS